MNLKISFTILSLLILNGSCAERDNEVCNDNDKDCKKVKPKYFQSKNIDVNEIYERLSAKLASIKESCSQICDISEKNENRYKTGSGKGVWGMDEMEKSVECRALFENEEIDRESELIAPPKKVFN